MKSESKAINMDYIKSRKKTKKTKAQLRAQKWREWKAFLKDDFDWDYGCILSMIQYKLARTRKCILENNIIMEAKAIHDEIKEVEDLFGRVMDDNYVEELWKPFKKKYGTLKMSTEPFIDKNGKELYRVKFRFTKDTSKNRGAVFKAWHNTRKKADQARLDDLKKAFALMVKNMWGWWD